MANKTKAAKHTPGPWEVSVDGQDILSHNKRIVSGPVGHRRTLFDNGEAEANARLIAAAPELLVELKQAEIDLADILDSEEVGRAFNSLDGGNGSSHKHFRATLDGIRTAIAKAEGK